MLCRVAALLLIAGLLPALAQVKPKTVRPTPAKARAVKPVKPQAKKIAPSRKRVAARGPQRQTQPTPDRYREIQEALIAKGFLDGPASGQWDQRSIEGLKKFERSQQLTDDGKLDSMTLIALGLGARRVQP